MEIPLPRRAYRSAECLSRRQMAGPTPVSHEPAAARPETTDEAHR
jgi:hypothetical protein